MPVIAPIPTLSVQGSSAIRPIDPIGAPAKTGAANMVDQTGKTFADILTSLNQSETQADSMVQQAAAGGDVDLASLMITMDTNDVNFKVAMSMRDKLVDAYHEVMRMQV